MIFKNFDLNEFKNLYVYGFGLSGRWLADNLSKKVEAYIDTDEKKNGKSHNNVSVITVNEASKKVEVEDLIIITVVDIQDVVPILDRKFKNVKWITLGEYLNSEKVTGTINLTNEKDDFVEYSLKAVEMCQKAYVNKDKGFLRSVDIVITEKCSLKCKDCSNLMQFFVSAKNFTADSIKENFEKLTSKISHIYEVRLIGGEPFMNKEIYEILDYFCRHNKITKLVVYTNGTIPLKEDRLKNFINSKLVFTITDYGKLSKNTDKVHNSLIKLDIPNRRHPPENWTDSGRMEDFKRTESEMIELFDACCGKNLYTSMYGKLYRCPFVANAESLKAIPYDEKNSISVDSDPEDILKYTKELKYIPACNYCNGRSFDAKEIVPAIQTRKPMDYKKYTYGKESSDK